MKRIIEDDSSAGLEILLGENVLLMCSNYFYTGKLVGVNKTYIELENPAIVYETGKWSDKNYTDSQPLHVKKWYVQLSAIESFGTSK